MNDTGTGTGASASSAVPTKSKFTAANVLEAIAILHGVGIEAPRRRAADQFLTEFQKSDAAVLVGLRLLAASPEELSGPLHPAALGQLAAAARRRMQRGSVPGASDPAETLRLAMILMDRDARTAKLMVNAAVAQWLHGGGIPTETLLHEACHAQGAALQVTLAALVALPEETNSRDVKLTQDARAQALLELSSVTPRVLTALSSGDSAANATGLRLAAATSWCMCCDLGQEAVAVLAASPLLAQAGESLARGPPDSSIASEFLEVLLDRSGSLLPCPEQLINSLLRVLSSIHPAGDVERGQLCSLVSTAVNSWRGIFVVASQAPPDAWVSLLEALVACCSWGCFAASATLSTWLALKEHAVKVGAIAQYAPVLASAVRALRSAAAFPSDYADRSLDYQEELIKYRRELRDALRALVTEPEERRAFVEELRGDVLGRLCGPWEPLEEAIHALSTPAAAICRTVGIPGCNVSGGAAAATVLEVLSALIAEGGPLLDGRCHRQLACTFIMCTSVYAQILSHAVPSTVGVSLIACVLAFARRSLQVRECPSTSEGKDAAFPFTVKQDHIGVVCLLRLSCFCASDPALTSPDTRTALCSDVRLHVAAAVAHSEAITLQAHSTVVLAEAVACLAKHHADTAHEVLAICFELACDGRAGSASVALCAAAEVVTKCGAAQGEAVASALVPVWQHLSDPRLDSQALAKFLSAVAEHAPAGALQTLAQLVAGLFKNQPNTRVPLLKVATSFAHRVGREGGPLVPLGAELIGGLSALVWEEVDRSGAALQRLHLVMDSKVRSECEVPEVTQADRALMEAWSDLTREAAKHAPAALVASSVGLVPVLSAATSLVALPMQNPPTCSLALLSHEWKEDHLRVILYSALNSTIAGSDMTPGAPWALGTVVLRAVMKALLGQMPPNALGVLVPAARAIVQNVPTLAETWIRSALAGDGFPSANTKPEAKERFVRELVDTVGDNQKFKQALKKVCGGKKKSP